MNLRSRLQSDLGTAYMLEKELSGARPGLIVSMRRSSDRP
jgi:hypothetical protein